MEMQGRYIVARASLADRRAEAARARLAKDDTVAEARPVVVSGSTPTLAGLRARLAGLRTIVRRPVAAGAASTSH